MGMTIKEAEINLHAIQVYYNDDMQDSYVGFDKEDNESIDFAIEIMQKYQKITEIVMNGDDTHYKLLMQIKEVVKDGNDT